jgi:hypothetical protein
MALDVFSDMFPKEELNEHKILNKLLTSDEHLNMKTRINEPIIVALFDTSAERFRRIFPTLKKEKNKSASLLEFFSKDWKELMVSFPAGEGRKEITTAIAGLRDQEKNVSMLERLTGLKRE